MRQLSLTNANHLLDLNTDDTNTFAVLKIEYSQKGNVTYFSYANNADFVIFCKKVQIKHLNYMTLTNQPNSYFYVLLGYFYYC